MPIDSQEFAQSVVGLYLPEAKGNSIGIENLATIILQVFSSGVEYGSKQTKDKIGAVLLSEAQAGNIDEEILQKVFAHLSGLRGTQSGD